VMRWVRRELVADSYGRGRVYLAGDSVHLTSPTGAMGMNTGMQDAVDLGWKLDAVLKGWAGPDLLSTYERERKPVAVRNIKASTENLERMLAPRTTHKPPPEVFQPGPAGDAARKAYGDWYTELMSHEWFMNGYHLGYRYDDSPIVVPDGTPAPPLEGKTYTQIARPGARAPHVWLADGRSTLDLYGRGFVLLRLGADAPAGEALQRAARERGVPFEVIAIDAPEVLKAYERRLVLVRPDGHVAWRADTEPEDAHAIVDRVRGVLAAAGAQAVSIAS
jgi:FAD binding domain